jgi:hypothetical protein
MAKRKSEKPQQPPPQDEKELQALYAKMRQQFTAADLQKYTEIEPGIPLEDVIAEMEEIHRQVSQSRRKKA